MDEVLHMTNLSSATLRYWETKFSELNSHKDERGNRYYTMDNINLIKSNSSAPNWALHLFPL